MHLTPERQMMTLRQFEHALDRHRQEAFAYLETLGEEDLQRKARIALFKPFLGADEVTVPTWVGVFFGAHWGDHADQLAKIRKAVGLLEATVLGTAT
jgi:hypothetical protein